MTRALMIQGTASHVGKSVLTAAFALWVQRRGLSVAPFKAQNMSNNSFVTRNGEEVARSQAAQAAVLGLDVTADMNPVLLKPLDRSCQVIVQGQGVGVMTTAEYYVAKPRIWPAITESYDRLAAAFDAVVLEGAGSPVEINLAANDLVNMRMARHADATVVLVADIERGGVFAQIVGTWELLEPADRERISGFLINKFRGDHSLLRPGLAYLRARTGKPILGVLPFEATVQLEEEDSLGVEDGPTAEIDVAVLRLPGLSNFTDFAALSRAPGVSVRYVSEIAALHRPDLLVLPGTRTTVRALHWLRSTGLADAITRLARAPDGPMVLGVCGGCQLLGQTIADPAGVEWTGPPQTGLALLGLETVFAPRKTLCRVTATVIAAGSLGEGSALIGYEVHQGESRRRTGAEPWLRLMREPGGEIVDDGAVSPDRRVLGTYVHGLFDDERFLRTAVAELRRRRGLTPLEEASWATGLPRRTDLAEWLERHTDLRPVVTALDS